MTTLILIRHAVHCHLGRVLSGRMPDIALSADGEAQAARLAAALAGTGIDRVQASPLTRTVQTARAIADAAGLPAPEPVEALNEIDFGAWAGRAFADLDGDPEWDRWNTARSSARAPAGESMVEAQARIMHHLGELARRHAGKRIAIVTHCDMIRAVVAHILGLSLDRLLRFDVDPASVTRIEMGEGHARVASLNEGIC